jgi:hypothetical protein
MHKNINTISDIVSYWKPLPEPHSYDSQKTLFRSVGFFGFHKFFKLVLYICYWLSAMINRNKGGCFGF